MHRPNLYSKAIANIVLPIELSSFSAAITNNDSVKLQWMTLSETNNFGFYVQRKADPDKAYSDILNSFAAGHGTTIVKQLYTFTDKSAHPGTWWYRLKQVDLDNSVQYSEPIKVQVAAGALDAKMVLGQFEIGQNFPNPFNPSTTIRYGMPIKSHVTLAVFNTLGQQVASLVNETQEAGYHEVRFDGTTLASGVYFYRIQAGSFVQTKRLIYLR